MQGQSDVESNMEQERKEPQMAPEQPIDNRNPIQDENQAQSVGLEGQDLQIEEEDNNAQMEEEEVEEVEEEEKKQEQAMEGEEPQVASGEERGNEEGEPEKEAEDENPPQEHSQSQEQAEKNRQEEDQKQMQVQHKQQPPIPEPNPDNHQQNLQEEPQVQKDNHQPRPEQEQPLPQQQEAQPLPALEQQNEEIQQQNEEIQTEPKQAFPQPQQIPLHQPREQRVASQLQEKQRRLEEQRSNLQSQKIQEYIHKLQRQLVSSNQYMAKLQSQSQLLRSTGTALRGELESIRQSSMQLRKKKLQVELQRTKLMKECQKLRKENEAHKSKMEQVQAIGDVFALKNTLEELKLLAETQKQEIHALKVQNEEERKSNKVQQHIQLFRKYQEREALATTKLQILSNQNQHLEAELKNLRVSVPQLQKQLQEAVQKVQQLQTLNTKHQHCITEWQQKWNEFQSQRQANRKARELEQSIVSYESQKNINQNQELMHLNILTDREEKNILMREYLILESKNKELTYDIQELTIRLRKLQREQTKVHANYIKKKQYMDLNTKYNKAKECLQGAFKQLRQYRSDPHNQSIAEEVNDLLEGVEARECQIFINNTNQIVSNLQDQVNNIEQRSLTNDLQLELAHSQSTIAALRKQISYNQKLLKLMNDDIHLKNKLIKQKNQVIDNFSRKKSNDQGLNNQKLMKLQSQIKGLKETLSVYETQNIILVKEIASLNSQACHWKHLYDEIKDNLTEKITLSMESSDHRHQHEKMQEEESHPNCKECELRKLALLERKETEDQQTQTDNLYQYYYKEIKDYLNFLKRTSKEYDQIPMTAKDLIKAVNQIKDRFISEFKEKFEKIQAVYRAKLEEVRKEKSENEMWRTKAREQIREEFQDIRQLVINNRLINALRQAKNLIDYLEKEVQNQDENQEEMQEEGVVSEEKKNE